MTVVHNKINRIVGSSRYYKWNPEQRQISIGFTFLEPDYRGDGTNREMKDLMLRHIFKSATWRIKLFVLFNLLGDSAILEVAHEIQSHRYSNNVRV